jgi:geranylgeranyl pyrophosphate synthase
MSFQIIDDLLDIIGDQSNTGKLVGNDIVEGKPTLPIIYGMRDPTVGIRIMDIFEDDRTDYNAAGEAITLIKRTDAIDRCYNLANYYADKAIAELGPIPDSVYKQALIDFAKFIVSRDR